jgi:hypothetical protein
VFAAGATVSISLEVWYPGPDIRNDCILSEDGVNIRLFLSKTGYLDQSAVYAGRVSDIYAGDGWWSTQDGGHAQIHVPANLAGGAYYLIAIDMDHRGLWYPYAVSDPITVLPGTGAGDPSWPGRGWHHGDGGWGDAGVLAADGGNGVVSPTSQSGDATAAPQLTPVISSTQQQPLTASPTNQIVDDSSNGGTESQSDGTTAPSTPISSDASGDSDPLQLGGTLRAIK